MTIGTPTSQRPVESFGYPVEEAELTALLSQQLRFQHDIVIRPPIFARQAQSLQGANLTSIVIPNYNGLSHLRMCLYSLRLYTRSPYEVIVIDNGSTDGSAEWLKDQPDVLLIANPENLGFPKACNQGIREARGDAILLLNNDVIVTPGWLERLRCVLGSSPEVGLVGPVTNRISGDQLVPAKYHDLPSLESYAGRWAVQNTGRVAKTDRLVGFCLLIRRDVIDQIGLLDEQFGIGNFEDDDLCRRAMVAGFRALISVETFVHHFCSVTFRSMGQPFANELMQRNAELFRKKWSKSPLGKRDEENGTRRTRACRLSLAMIVRDNEDTIEAAMRSIKPWVDEMIVVDTGSKDQTPDICRDLGAKVFEFPWCDDFSAARNESLKHCTGDWIFWMDSDDVIDEGNGRALRALLAQAIPETMLGFVVQVHCPNRRNDGTMDKTVVDHVKLLRNRPDLRFEGRIHEQILPAIRAANGDVAFSDLFVIHAGSDQSENGKARKIERDLRILHAELEEQPEHPFVLFNLGMTYADIDEHDKAIDYLLQSINLSDPGQSQVRKAYALLVGSCMQANRIDEAWQACANGRALFPKDPELLFREGMIHHHLGRLHQAARAYLAALSNDDDRHFTSIDPDIVGNKARHNLARVYEDMEDYPKALQLWQQIVSEVPGYRLGWRGIGEIYLKQERWDEASSLAERLLHDPMLHSPALRAEGALLAANISIAIGQPGQACQLLDEALAHHPADIDLLRSLSKVVFEQKAPDEALPVLKHLASADPKDASAHHNLGTIYLRLDRYDESIQAFEQSLRLRPKSTMTSLYLGHALSGAGRHEEALAVWKDALRGSPGDASLIAAIRQTSPSSQEYQSSPATELTAGMGKLESSRQFF